MEKKKIQMPKPMSQKKIKKQIESASTEQGEITGIDDNRPKPKLCYAESMGEKENCVFPACHCGLPSASVDKGVDWTDDKEFVKQLIEVVQGDYYNADEETSVIIDKVIGYCKTIEADREQDAVEFAEWLTDRNNNIVGFKNVFAEQYKDKAGKHGDILELYQLFKQKGEGK